MLGIAAGGGAGRQGAEDGPHALRELGLIDGLARLGYALDDLGDIPGVHETYWANNPAENIKNMPRVLQFNRHIHDCIRGAWRQRQTDDFLLFIGGDHSLAIGTLAGLSDCCERLGLIWIDAHADFNTPVTSPSGNAHGMSLAVACGHGHLELRSIAASDPMIEEADVHVFGCRDLDAGEIDALNDSDVHLLEMPQWRDAGIIDSVIAAARTLANTCDHVHLSFDIDVLDSPFVPGTGTPVVGGLTQTEASELLQALGATGVLSSAEFVEYNPHLDNADRSTGHLTRDLIEGLLAAMTNQSPG